MKREVPGGPPGWILPSLLVFGQAEGQKDWRVLELAQFHVSRLHSGLNQPVHRRRVRNGVLDKLV